MNGWKRYIQKRVNRDKTDFATKARMLGLPASAGAPLLAETGGLAVAQLLPPCRGLRYDFLRKKLWTVPLILQFNICLASRISKMMENSNNSQIL